jgi:tRNA-dihydrouridine synthase
MRHSALAESLERGIFLSSMMGITDGRYAAAHGRGARMVQIGALVADLLDRSHEPRALLPEEQPAMAGVLRAEVDAVRRSLPGVAVCLNLAAGDLESALRATRAFHEAGGDVLELNCHGGYRKLHDRGLLRAMVRPERRATLREWLRALCATPCPVVVKLNGSDGDTEAIEALAAVADIEDLFGVHLNVRNRGTGAPDLELARRARAEARGMLWCSGYVRERHQVVELMDAGAGCVGIAQAVRDQPFIIARLAACE